MSGAAGGAAVGALAATVINSVIRSRYSKEHEKEADRIGTELALARGFDPEEAVRFWERQHERFGKRSPSPKIGNSLFGSHPQDRVRAENLRALLAADLKSAIDDKRTGGGLVTGTPRFGNVISGLMRDTGTLMAERSDPPRPGDRTAGEGAPAQAERPAAAVGTGTDLPYGRPN